jgi:hypothetical protein
MPEQPPPTATALRIGHQAAQAYLDDPRHATNLRTREILDEHFARCHLAAMTIARDCLLNLIADAKRFDEDVDGDEVNGRSVVYVDYHITTSDSQLRDLAETLGITPRWGETVGDALIRVITAEEATPHDR